MAKGETPAAAGQPGQTGGAAGDLIWITEAMLEYGKSRGWFTARLKRGELHAAPQPGTSKVFLHRSEIEAALAERRS